jgi:hypothetical protein
MLLLRPTRLQLGLIAQYELIVEGRWFAFETGLPIKQVRQLHFMACAKHRGAALYVRVGIAPAPAEARRREEPRAGTEASLHG